MSQRFCTNCGSPLDTQLQRFCTRCGAPAPDDPSDAVGRMYDPTPAPESVSVQSGVYDPKIDVDPVGKSTQQNDPWQPRDMSGFSSTAPMYPPPVTPVYPQTPKRSMSKSSIVPIAAAILVAIGIIAAALLLSQPQPAPTPVPPEVSSSASSGVSSPTDRGSDDSTSSSAVESSSSRNDEPSSSSSAIDEDAIYNELVDIYDTMGTQGDRIKGVATTLNNTIFTSDQQARQSAAREAHSLFDEVDSQLTRLKTMRSDYSSSRYRNDMDTLIELQQDLYNRIDVMCQAWDISLSYSKPKDHEAEIKKPLGKDNDSNGVNVYKKDFEKRYPGARPTR